MGNGDRADRTRDSSDDLRRHLETLHTESYGALMSLEILEIDVSDIRARLCV